MTQSEVRKLAHELMKNNNLRYDFTIHWTFKFNNSKRCFGMCYYGEKTIEYSIHFLNEPEEQIRNTILHEMAHAYAGRVGHSRPWKIALHQLGGKVERTSVACAKTIDHLVNVSRYVATCEHCGKQHYFNRKVKRAYSCPCKGNYFNVNTLLTFKLNK